VNPDERAAAVRRLTFLIAAVLIWTAAIFCRLVSMQVMQHQKYLALARRQQEHVITIQAPRGYIYDRTGRPLAISVPVDSVFVNPLRLPDIATNAAVIAPILKLERQKLEQELRQAAGDHRGFLWVKRKISAEESRRLRDLKCDWIGLQTESVREYPDEKVAAHLLGGVYKDEEGFAGVEKRFDKELRGQAGAESVVIDLKNRVLDSEVDKPAKPGESLTLTIDARIQFIAEEQIAEAVKKHHARSGSVIAMNPNTGEIYAVANYPTYNPGEPPKPGDDPLARLNLGVQVPFEPGSIFKIMTVSAALETTNLTPDSPINCMGGVIHLPGRTIHDSHGGLGVIPMREVIERSSNIGAIQIGTRVGREHLYEYVRRFGFGAPTGVPLPAESGGKVRKLERWGTTSLASVSMGQEVSTTSIQLARACSVIANGGTLVQPKLVLRRGEKLEPTVPGKRIIRPETAITVRSIMEGVVLRGTARNTVKVPGYSVAGKTGTAQIFDTRIHQYTHTYNASFMGFTPIQNPALVIVVTINGTRGDAGFGGAAAGPVFNVVAAEALRVLDVPKDMPESEELRSAKGNPNDANDVAIAGLDESRPNILEDDEDPAETAQRKESDEDRGDQAEPDQRKPVIVEGAPRVPNFTGKTVREVMELASQTGIPVVLAGSGVVTDQAPLAGEVLLPGQKVKVKFAR
jgi:cell division protein FtsI (penicillin-binding protein 3)